MFKKLRTYYSSSDGVVCFVGRFRNLHAAFNDRHTASNLTQGCWVDTALQPLRHTLKKHTANSRLFKHARLITVKYKGVVGVYDLTG